MVLFGAAAAGRGTVGVVLGFLWVGFLVVVAVLVLALDYGVIPGRPLI